LSRVSSPSFSSAINGFGNAVASIIGDDLLHKER
jgi:hypothetical protein